MDLDGEVAEPPGAAQLARLQQLIQHRMDKSIPWIRARWATFTVALLLLIVRIYVKQGFFVIAYGLGVYLLNLLINFLSPAVDPESQDGPSLPTKETGEFRPFVRKLPEFKFWSKATSACCMCVLATFSQAFDLPVFWPILLAYFILLFTLSMKDRVKHMIKHKYIPFSIGKETYGELTKVKVPGAASKDSK